MCFPLRIIAGVGLSIAVLSAEEASPIVRYKKAGRHSGRPVRPGATRWFIWLPSVSHVAVARKRQGHDEWNGGIDQQGHDGLRDGRVALNDT